MLSPDIVTDDKSNKTIQEGMSKHQPFYLFLAHFPVFLRTAFSLSLHLSSQMYFHILLFYFMHLITNSSIFGSHTSFSLCFQPTYCTYLSTFLFRWLIWHGYYLIFMDILSQTSPFFHNSIRNFALSMKFRLFDYSNSIQGLLYNRNWSRHVISEGHHFVFGFGLFVWCKGTYIQFYVLPSDFWELLFQYLVVLLQH